MAANTIFSNGNAASLNATFESELHDIVHYDWDSVFSRDWNSNGITNRALKGQMMSECLILKEVSILNIEAIYCSTLTAKVRVDEICNELGAHINVEINESFFFVE